MACIVVDRVALPVPSKEAEPTTSPDKAIVLDVARAVAVAAFPVVS